MDDEKKEAGRVALAEMKMMYKRWLRSDFKWAVGKIICGESTGEEDEWGFLLTEWMDKIENWMSPYVFRLYKTGYVTDEDLRAFGAEVYEHMHMMLEAISTLRRDVDNGEDS